MRKDHQDITNWKAPLPDLGCFWWKKAGTGREAITDIPSSIFEKIKDTFSYYRWRRFDSEKDAYTALFEAIEKL